MTTWKETLEELEPEVRNLYLNELKLKIDVIMNASALTLEYEKLRFTLIGDVEVVALEGYCTECKQRSALKMKIEQYYQRLAHAFTPLNGLVMQCPKCNSPNTTLQLLNVWLKDHHPLYT
jgi:Zn finger protein HypA/HybF involved in hydrogenase expression